MPAVKIDEELLGKQIQKMEHIIDKKSAELERENYNKYNPVYEAAIEYLKTRPVLLYGGLAIDEIMPKSKKIYSPYTLPDIDLFTYKPMDVAKGLVRHMKKHGFKFTSMGEALHEGTMKIYSEGKQIVDLTYIPRVAYKKISKHGSSSSLGIKIVDPQYLRMSLHNILSHPNLDRWPKVLKRIVTFYSVFPPKKCNIKTLATDGDDDLLQCIRKAPLLKEGVLFGAEEIAMIADLKHIPCFRDVPPVMALVENPLQVAKNIVATCSDWELHISELYPTEVHTALPPHLFLTYKRRKVVLLFDATSCFTYNTVKNMKVASIHSIIYLYLSILSSTYKHFDGMLDAIECIANALTYLHLKTFYSQRKVLQQFALSCFGPEHGVATMRRAKMARVKK